MAVVKDWRGNKIEVGSTVVYPSRQSSSLWVNEGVVESVEDYEDAWGRKAPRIGVRRTKTSGYDRLSAAQARVSYPDPSRLTVMA